MKKRQKIRQAVLIVSFVFFPVTIFYFSPYLPIMGGIKGIVVGSLFTFLALFVISLFTGRLFCGWLCPAGGLQEMCFSAKDTRVEKGNWIKFLIWVPWISAVTVLLVRSRENLRFDPLYMTWHGISLHSFYSYIAFFGFLFLVILLAFTVGRRSFCHHACWIVPFMILGHKVQRMLKLPSLKLSADEDKCNSCTLCTKNCPMSLNVVEMVHGPSMENSECILCGQCADSCKKEVITYTFK